MRVIDRAIDRLAARAAAVDRDAEIQAEITERLRVARFRALLAYRRSMARRGADNGSNVS